MLLFCSPSLRSLFLQNLKSDYPPSPKGFFTTSPPATIFLATKSFTAVFLNSFDNLAKNCSPRQSLCLIHSSVITFQNILSGEGLKI
ncbi:hypothetical protein K1719_038774 [Acacia pycnantha]|nr:hypothetical protein K1719_038774 [Acacia pycnantha]